MGWGLIAANISTWCVQTRMVAAQNKLTSDDKDEMRIDVDVLQQIRFHLNAMDIVLWIFVIMEQQTLEHQLMIMDVTRQ